MKQRKHADIWICRTVMGDSGVEEVQKLYLAPITDKSSRRFRLMQEDCIQLSFSMDNALISAVDGGFSVGDYIDDELFGRFYIREQQMPSYDNATGGYRYELEFVAPYYMWGNHLFMLTTTASGERVRKEADWTLTAKLETHAQEVLHNLSVLGIDGYSVKIEDTAEHALEVRCVAYSGKDIISALGMIADEWECEWWVTGKTLHFGKCELDDEPLTLTLGENVESMTVQRDSNAYANKIYAFGGTRNVPDTYDAELVFTADTTQTLEGLDFYADSKRPIELKMIDATDENDPDQAVAFGATERDDDDVDLCTLTAESDSFTGNSGGSSTLAGELKIILSLNQSTPVSITLSVWNETHEIETIYHWEGNTAQFTQNIAVDYPMPPNETFRLRVVATYEKAGKYESVEDIAFAVSSDLLVSSDGASKRATLYLADDTERSNPYPVLFNPLRETSGGRKRMFVFTDGEPEQFLGQSYFLETLTVAVPTSYYTRLYSDPSALSKIGERRLHLPAETGGFVMQDSSMPADKVVEMSVVFDKVFPRLVLKVSGVTETEMQETEQFADGSSAVWKWTQYNIRVTTLDGQPFSFSLDYMLDGETLQVQFLSDTEEIEACGTYGISYQPHDGYKLAGMTFDARFGSQSYTLIRNESFGAKLPGVELRPEVGDPLVLIGWNPKAIVKMGLIEAAENELLEKTASYLDAIRESQFTFTCALMSDLPFSLADNSEDFACSDGALLQDSDGEAFQVRGNYSSYLIPMEGRWAIINHEALPEPKHSRVIGYELKLDMPYDTPQLIVGDTDAYSRLKRIEKELTRLG